VAGRRAARILLCGCNWFLVAPHSCLQRRAEPRRYAAPAACLKTLRRRSSHYTCALPYSTVPVIIFAAVRVTPRWNGRGRTYLSAKTEAGRGLWRGRIHERLQALAEKGSTLWRVRGAGVALAGERLRGLNALRCPVCGAAGRRPPSCLATAATRRSVVWRQFSPCVSMQTPHVTCGKNASGGVAAALSLTCEFCLRASGSGLWTDVADVFRLSAWVVLPAHPLYLLHVLMPLSSRFITMATYRSPSRGRASSRQRVAGGMRLP